MENNALNWGEVVDFFSKKYILTRASFINSTATLNGDTLNVQLSTKGKFLLLQKNIDKTVSDFIFNTTGNRYKIEFNEPDITDFEIQRDNIQNSIVQDLIKENERRAQEAELKKSQEEETKKVKTPTNKATKAMSNIEAKPLRK